MLNADGNEWGFKDNAGKASLSFMEKRQWVIRDIAKCLKPQFQPLLQHYTVKPLGRAAVTPLEYLWLDDG